ncbi:PAS domain-containing sensor histidine kinase [Azovibrio restrictus]|uniref:PAS domain-containing sensor histidine kinase n=1 Tax=Azovibrio restrictus TaxID=146938 RepID=UPI0005BAAD0D|nr:ATP-binding protein [Azovibrio restrictus]
MSTTSPASEPLPGAPESMGEQAWIQVIQKMDEVYNDLLQYEVALEEKNAALEESHQFIESIIASMSDILVVCDRNGRIQEVNPAFLQFSGKDEQELKDTSLFDLFADPEERARARHLFAVFGQEGVHDCELHLRAGDGSVMPVSLNCTPRVSQTGKLMGMVVTGRPVGELRRAYQQLRQAHEDLKRTQGQLLHAEKMASLGRLVAGVAHELNNPISFVLGNVLSLKRYAGRLQDYLDDVHADPLRAADPYLAARRQELRIDRILQDMPPLIEGMIEGAERTRDIVDALKRFSAVDRMRPERVNLTEVVERAVRWVAKSAPAHFVIDQELPRELYCVGSPGQLQQVVMNLVQNACDAAGQEAAPRLLISGRQEDGAALLEFRDNGPGIPAELMPRLFEPFFTTKPVGQGTGLGLSISYGIIERHGGSLTAANAPAGGACFTLRLPLARD